MFKILISLFQSKNKKISNDDSTGNESIEKKKCKRCLRRVDYYYVRCIYCGGEEFYDN